VKRPSLRPSQSLQPPQCAVEKGTELADSSLSQPPVRQLSPSSYTEISSGGDVEQTWMTQMVSEIARKVQDQKAADSGFWDRHDPEMTPPPAYGA